MAWPLYFAQNLTLGNPESGVGLCLLWTPQDRVLPELNSADYAVAGNLYSRDGVSYLLRNLLARPTLRTILLCGKDMTGSGAALAALFANGVDAQGRIIGEGTRLHAEIPHEAIELVRRNVTLHDARDVVRAPQVAELLAQLRCAAAPFAPAPLEFP
jgi:thymidylate synthase